MEGYFATSPAPEHDYFALVLKVLLSSGLEARW
jgi:hypothetical protein